MAKCDNKAVTIVTLIGGTPIVALCHDKARKYPAVYECQHEGSYALLRMKEAMARWPDDVQKDGRFVFGDDYFLMDIETNELHMPMGIAELGNQTNH
jgi:hypothetical protein